MTQTQRPTAAFVLSLVAGLFITLGGAIMSMAGVLFGGMMGYSGYDGMMGPGSGMMSYPGYGMVGFAFGIFEVLGLIFGVIVIISAIMLNNRPQEHTIWGTIIVLFSVLSIFGGAMGGFGVGLILGLIGGVLGITWRPSSTLQPS